MYSIGLLGIVKGTAFFQSCMLIDESFYFMINPSVLKKIDGRRERISFFCKYSVF